MIPLSKTELVIVNALEFEGPKSLEQIADRIYEGRSRPKHWRSSVAAIMRYLRIKTMHWDRPVLRTSGIGCGRKAEYALGTSENRRRRSESVYGRIIGETD